MTRTLINPLRHRLALVAHVALLALTTALSPSAQAADNPSDPPGAADRLASARALIAENKWQAAIQELKSVDATQSADWHNLMGYSHRKARTPDLAAAERRSGPACLNSTPRFLSGLRAGCRRCRVVHGGGRRLRRTDRRGGQLGAHQRSSSYAAMAKAGRWAK
jgi:hypothetical protein